MQAVKQLIVIGLLLFVLRGYSIDPKFTCLTVGNGLSANHVKSILQDQEGFLWFGTIEGLDRYDGYEIRTYSRNFPSGSQNINCLLNDIQGNIWVGTERGLFVRKEGKNNFSLFDEKFSSTRVTCLANLDSGKIGVGTDQGLLILHSATGIVKKTLFSENSSSPVNYMTGLVVDKYRTVWIATHNGLVKFEPSSGFYKIIKDSLGGQENFFSCITRMKDDLYLGRREHGLVRYNIGPETFDRVPDINNQFILSLASGQNGRLYIGTDGGGLNILNTTTGSLEFLSHDPDDPATLSSNSVYSVLETATGYLWVGTFSAGVSLGKVKQLRFKIFNPGSGNQLLNKSIRSLHFWESGNKILGSRDGLYTISDNGDQLQLYRSGINASGLRSNIILAIKQYKGKTLVGTYGGGVSVFDPVTHRFSAFMEQPDFISGCFYGFQEDRQGNLWMATLNGLFCYSPVNKRLTHFTSGNSKMISNDVFSILFDSRNRLWVGTMQGISLFTVEDEQLIPITLSGDHPCNFKINYIYEDSGRNIWICSESGGLYRTDQNLQSCEKFLEENGLPSNSICALIETSPGVFWISSLKGLCKLVDKHTENYTVSDGLPGLAFSPAAVLRSKDGIVWFGNETGLVYFNPDSIRPKSEKIEPVITDFYLSGNRIEPGINDFLPVSLESTDEIRLKQEQNSVGFRFVALNYINPADQYYEYQLTGFDREWRLLHGQNIVFYENLRPGKYVFKVRMAGISADASPVSREVIIIIRSSFYRHPLFIALILMVAAGLAWKISRRYKQQLDKVHLLEEKSKPQEKYRHSRLAGEETQNILSRMKLLMEEKQPFLDPDLKLADIAEKMGVSVHEVSQAINQSLHWSFSDYINHYRIAEVKKRMADPRNKRLTLLAIAQECGFSSKTSFYRIFKKETGQTPAEYLASTRKK